MGPPFRTVHACLCHESNNFVRQVLEAVSTRLPLCSNHSMHTHTASEEEEEEEDQTRHLVWIHNKIEEGQSLFETGKKCTVTAVW